MSIVPSFDISSIADSSIERGTPISFVIGAGQVPKGIDEGVRGMRLFGRRKLIVPPELGFGSAGKPPRIPSDATLTIAVEVLAIQSGNPPAVDGPGQGPF